MKTIEIRHRITAAVLYSCEVVDDDQQPIRTAIERAVKTRANLTRANLTDADLTDADLAGAYLTDANLTRANLTDADLAGANLARAYLARANLTDADLTDADLTDADLTDADLAGASNLPSDVTATDPHEPYERKVTPRAQRLAERAKAYRELHPDVPVVEQLDRKILALIDAGTGSLNMSDWHTCETTHCRAGWAIHLAGAAGYALEKRYDAERAGVMIYRASTGRVPNFFASNERALEDIKMCASEEATP